MQNLLCALVGLAAFGLVVGAIYRDNVCIDRACHDATNVPLCHLAYEAGGKDRARAEVSRQWWEKAGFTN